MASLTLVIGNKNYSSWSLRPWLALKQTGQPFTEVRIPLDTPTTQQEIRRYSPSGRVPVLLEDSLVIWESLAICEYLAESFPQAQLWPQDRVMRAHARCISHEMHAGFSSLRHHMPMDCRGSYPGEGLKPDVQQDIDRITAIWRECRQQFGQNGDLLFGHFSIADAMYAPVVFRFQTYGVPLDPISRAYADALLALPAIQDWVTAARAEPEEILELNL